MGYNIFFDASHLGYMGVFMQLGRVVPYISRLLKNRWEVCYEGMGPKKKKRKQGREGKDEASEEEKRR